MSRSLLLAVGWLTVSQERPYRYEIQWESQSCGLIHYSLDVHEPLCSELPPSVISHTIRFLRPLLTSSNESRYASVIGESTSPTLLLQPRPLSQLSQALSVIKSDCFYSLWNDTLPQPFEVHSVCILVSMGF
jgi:hypothetical protein